MKFPGYRLTLLAALNAEATSERMRFLDAWRRCEGGGARFNPWNTTLRLPGSQSYNSVGVQHYLDHLQGNAATLLTIRLNAYAPLRTALQAPGFSAIEIAVRSGSALDTWGTGRERVIAALR